MVKLLGSETANTPTQRNLQAQQIYACKFTASATGTLEELHLKLGAEQLAGGVWLGVYADSGGFPGTLLGQVKVEAANGEQTLAASGLKVTVTKGVAYWTAAVAVSLALHPVTSANGGEANQKRAAGHETLVELASGEWTTGGTQGPEIFYGLGSTLPTVTKPPDQSSVAEGPIPPLQIEATLTTTYEASGLPTGFSINAATGAITGTPTVASPVKTVTITCKNENGEATTSFAWLVEAQSAYRKAILANPNLLAYLPLNEPRGTTAFDLGPGKYNGTAVTEGTGECVNGEAALRIGDPSAKSKKFVGTGTNGIESGGEIQLPEAVPKPTEALTLEMWVRLLKDPDYNILLFARSNEATGDEGVAMSAGVVEQAPSNWMGQQGFEYNLTGTTAIGATFFHLAGAVAKGFGNGALVAFDHKTFGAAEPGEHHPWYIVGATEGGFEVAEVPNGMPLKVGGHAVEEDTTVALRIRGGLGMNVENGAHGGTNESPFGLEWTPEALTKESGGYLRADGKAHYLCMTFDKGAVVIQLDDKVVPTEPAFNSGSKAPKTISWGGVGLPSIGAAAGRPGQYSSTSLISDFAFYGTALTPAERLAHYALGGEHPRGRIAVANQRQAQLAIASEPQAAIAIANDRQALITIESE